MATRPFLRKSNKATAVGKKVREVLCRNVMQHPHSLLGSDSMATVLDALTKHDWDHVFIVDQDGAPMGRIHAVDLLKMVAKKTVNRDIAWMHSIPAQQALTHPPMTVRATTPLLKAGALMLTHDLNQIGVVDEEGTLIGVVGHNTVARVLPRFLL
jgi:CBS domain-containing protein